MRRTLSFAVALALVFVQSSAQQQQPAPQRDPATPPAPAAPPPQGPLPAPRLRAEDYGDEAARIIGAALTDDTAYRRLAYLGDRIGHRLSGSAQLERAIEWAVAEMKKDRLDNVRTEKVMVPHWVRGAESLELLEPASTTRDLAMLGLGGSVGTAPEGLTAEAVVVRTFDELDALGEKVRGKIVVYNAPFTEYGATVQYRGAGPSRAARYGAVAALVRSVGPVSLQTPHTGSLRYDEAQPRIPAAAVTIEAAEMMQRMQARGETIRLRLKMEAKFRPDAESANVVAELKGRERPEEIVLVGGHFDSWDVGQGAHDDGGGCMVAWEAIRLLKKLNLRPRRTIRAVLFTNEENGLRGANGLPRRAQERGRQPPARHRVRLRRLPPHRLRPRAGGPAAGARRPARDRPPARRHPRRPHRRRRRRRRHRPAHARGRHRRQPRRGRPLLQLPPHARRHRR